MKKFTWFVTILLVASMIFGIFGCKEQPVPGVELDKTAPAEVTELTVTASNGNALLSWSNPSDEDFVGVQISATPANGTLKNAVSLGKEVTSFEVSGLENGKEYTFLVKTYDKSLNYSVGVTGVATVLDTADYVAPAEVTELTVTASNGNAVLSWKNPSDKDFAGLQISMNPAEGTLKNAVILGKDVTSLDVSGLVNGKEYTFTVKAFDESLNYSEGVTTETTVVDTSDKTAPKDVTDVTVTASDGYALLTWKNPSDEDFAGLQISMNPAEGTLKNTVILGKDVTSLDVSGLSNGKEYTFTVKAFDESLNYSEGVTAKTTVVDTSDKTAPTEVTSLEAINNDASVLLTWKDATDNDILGYEVSWDKSIPINRAVSLSENSMMVAPKAQGCYISNLTNGTTYSFTVKSVDTSGNRSKGQTISITPAFIEKSPLVIELELSTTEKTKESVEISVEVTTDFSSNIKKIACKEGTITNIEEVLKDTDITTTQKIIAKNNTTYTVVATDTAGRREIKWITVDNIDLVPPAQVDNFYAEYNKDSETIFVSWENPSDEDFAGTILTYKKRNSTDITTFEFDKNITSTEIEDILNDRSDYIISIKTKDDLDNISSAKTTTVIAYSYLSFTLDVGKGFLGKEGNLVSNISISFEQGETISAVLSNLGFGKDLYPYYFYDDEKSIYYMYEEDGFYYDCATELKFEDGTILTENDIYNKLYSDTTIYFHYRKLIPITYNLNGGIYNDSTNDVVKYEYEGLNYFSLSEGISKDELFFRGWTKTIDGEDYVTVCPSEPTTLYAKWEEPKTCELTLKPGEYSSLCGYSSLSFNFQSGKNLGDVLSEKGYTFANIVEESEIVGKRFGGFKDSQGNEYNEYTMLTESVELEAITRDLYYNEVGINMNLNGETLDDIEEYCVYIEIDEYEEYLEEISEVIQGLGGDLYFVGWTYTKDGDDFVTSFEGGTTTTIYAKWVSEVILPYYYSDDKTQLTFIFRPADFSLSWSEDEVYTVKLLSNANGWDTSNQDYNFTKNSDGNYTLTLNEIPSELVEYPIFHFFVSESSSWLGWQQYSHTLPDNAKVENSYDFVLNILPEMKLTIDPNEGNIGGDSSVIVIDKSRYSNYFHTNVYYAINDLGVQNPTKDGYIFAGWTLTKDGSDFVDYKYEHLPYGNYTLYAKWNEDSNCTLTLNAPENSEFVNRDGNSLGATLELSFYPGKILSEVFWENNLSFDNCLNPFEMDENYFTFNGTFTSNTDGDVVFEENSILRESITLFPVFETGLKKVDFNLNGGYILADDGFTLEGNGSTDFKYLTTLIPQKNNYYFGGWTITPDGEDFINETDEAYYVSLGSPYLYAKWLSVTEVLGQATWYYLDIPTDAQNVIFNAGENQTIDIMGIDVSSGSIYYAWDSTGNRFESNTSLIYEPDNKPEGQPGRVWCYTNASSTPNCFWWGCDAEADNVEWPGKPMTKEGELPSEEYTFTIKSIELVDASEIGSAGYYAFCEGWVPNNVWGATTPNKVTSKTGNNIVFEVNCDYTSIVPATIPIQILNPSSDGEFWYDESKVGGGTLSVNIPEDCDGKTYVWKIYAQEGYWSELVEVTE